MQEFERGFTDGAHLTGSMAEEVLAEVKNELKGYEDILSKLEEINDVSMTNFNKSLEETDFKDENTFKEGIITGWNMCVARIKNDIKEINETQP